jgi:hypothetical protein
VGFLLDVPVQRHGKRGAGAVGASGPVGQFCGEFSVAVSTVLDIGCHFRGLGGCGVR